MREVVENTMQGDLQNTNAESFTIALNSVELGPVPLSHHH